MAPVLDDLAELIVERLNRIGGVMILRTAGGKARIGVKRSQADSQARTAVGYFCPQAELATSWRAVSAASMVGAV